MRFLTVLMNNISEEKYGFILENERVLGERAKIKGKLEPLAVYRNLSAKFSSASSFNR